MRPGLGHANFVTWSAGIFSTPGAGSGEMAGMTRPQVLHYLGYDEDRGGILSVVRALAECSDWENLLGVNPTFVSKQPLGPSLLVLPRVEGERIAPSRLLSTRRAALALRAWLAADPRRLVHAHSRAGLLVALWLAHWGERRVLVSVHCYGRRPWFYRWAARRLAGRLFWLSPAMKAHYGIRNPDTWEACVPGCFRAPGPEIVRSSYHGVLRLGGVGLLSPWKGWHLVLEAMARLPEATRKRFCFSHIGAAPGPAEQRYRDSLLERRAQLGLGEAFQLLGERPEARSFLAECDALVLPSHNEPFSVAMLEALSQGLPVLAADTGGARDVLVDGQNGLLFRSGDLASLARGIESLEQRKLRVEPETLARFSADTAARTWGGIYAKLLEREPLRS